MPMADSYHLGHPPIPSGDFALLSLVSLIYIYKRFHADNDILIRLDVWPGRYEAPMVYENTPIQYTANFHGCKKDNFQMKNCDVFFLFLLKTWIVCTRLNRLSEAVLTSTHNLCFGAKIRKTCTPVNPSFTI